MRLQSVQISPQNQVQMYKNIARYSQEKNINSHFDQKRLKVIFFEIKFGY